MIDPNAYWFDERAATVAVNFFERLLRHSKGQWAGQLFTLQPWQKDDIIRPLFGWKRVSDNTRRYRRAYLEIPRKNGKSTLSAGLALYLLFADGEMGAEVYSAAADRDQAGIVFREAAAMVETSPELFERAKVYTKSITYKETRSTYKVLSADAFTKHGLNASGVVIDELHAQPDRELFDVLTTSTGARRQPMTVMITTAGFDRESICYEQHVYADQVARGVIDDPEWFTYIRGAEKGDDWKSPSVWAKANPGFDVTIKATYLAAEALRATNSPAYQNTFRRLHLNEWTQQESRWLDLDKWEACGLAFDPAILEDQPCYGGLDLASSSDIASFVLDFPSEPGEEEHHTWLEWHWIPAENMRARIDKDKVPYDAWSRDGYITATPGNVIDYGCISGDIIKLGERFNIKEIAFDRWGAAQLSTDLDGHGFEMIGHGQGFASMSQPSIELLRVVVAKRLRHLNTPVMRWMVDNVVVTQDGAGNIKPNKEKSKDKIDGIVAGIMALGRATRNMSKKQGSVYAGRGIRTL